MPAGLPGGTEFGHLPGEKEPELLVADATLREQAIGVTVQLVVGERCALAASSGLINAAPDEASKRFLATQTLDEARHVEVFTQRLYDLGVKKTELEDVIRQHANPNLVKFAEILLEKVDRKDFVAGVVGQNIVLEGMAFHVFEMMHAGNAGVNPKFAHTLSGTIADERRHVGFGENRIGSLIREHPERKPEIERMQREMSYWMLATFADSFRDRPAREELRALRETSGIRCAEGEVAWRGPRRPRTRGDGAAARRHRAEGVQDPARAHRARVPDAGAAVSNGADDATVTSLEVHGLPHDAFLEHVHSFEFWFESVQGYLAGTSYGHRPDVAAAPLSEAERERLITVLCNYCLGETAALDGASGLIGIAPNRLTKVFLSTQVVDEGRHLEVLLHRLRELGVADPETEIEKRASPGAAALSSDACSSWSRGRDWEAALFAQNVILEAMEFTVFQTHAQRADPITREVLRRHRQGRAPPHRLRRERAGTAAARLHRTPARVSAK